MARDAVATGGTLINLASDTALPTPCFGLWVGGAGAVKVDTADGDIGLLISGVAAGQIVPVQCTKVYSTGNGTTATLVIALKR